MCAQVDVKELTGGKLKLVEGTGGEDSTAVTAMATFQAPSGARPPLPRPCIPRALWASRWVIEDTPFSRSASSDRCNRGRNVPGASFQVFEEASVMSQLLYTAAPKGSATLAPVRPVDRRVTWVSTPEVTEPEVEAAAADAEAARTPKRKPRAEAEGESPKKHKSSKKGKKEKTPRKKDAR